MIAMNVVMVDNTKASVVDINASVMMVNGNDSDKSVIIDENVIKSCLVQF